MATIKSYTDIEQSKILAETLPLESADMYYNFYRDEWNEVKSNSKIPSLMIHSLDDIPCWSVEALLEIIPGAVLGSIIDNEGNKLWYCNTIQFGEEYFSYDGNYHNNQIDACFEVISWLLENNYIKKGE